MWHCRWIPTISNLLGPIEQTARHTPQSRRHCLSSPAAEIMFVLNSLVIHLPPHPPPNIIFPTSPFHHPLLHHLYQAQQACGCLHGVQLHCASGHWYWHWQERTQKWNEVWSIKIPMEEKSRKLVRHAILDGPHISVQFYLSVSHDTFQRRFHEEHGIKKMCTKWVPHS